MPLAALLVHQLRYYLAYGDGAPQALAQQGHTYLTSLTPWIVSLAALALGGLLIRLAQDWAEGTDKPRSNGTLGLWVVASLGLLTIYAGQEFLEGLFAMGHPIGIAGVFGYGGWWAVLASLLVGALFAFGLRGAHAVYALLARGRSFGRQRLTQVQRQPLAVLAVPSAPLARCAAERAPPVPAAPIA